jgi:Ca2+-binding RTX toxin-like protein
VNIRPLRAALPPLLVALVVGGSLAASTIVPASRADRETDTITANKLKPTSCSGLTLTRVLTGSGTITDGSQSSLILGGSAIDTIRGGGGADCLLGGGGNDSLGGDSGTDVCIGGPGTDTFTSSCETKIQ